MKIVQQEIFLIIKEIINRWDPIGLLEDGAPDDEYDFEILKITNQITDYNSIYDLSNYIYNLFLKMFGDEINSKAKERYECDKIAKCIFQKIQKQMGNKYKFYYLLKNFKCNDDIKILYHQKVYIIKDVIQYKKNFLLRVFSSEAKKTKRKYLFFENITNHNVQQFKTIEDLVMSALIDHQKLIDVLDDIVILNDNV